MQTRQLHRPQQAQCWPWRQAMQRISPISPSGRRLEVGERSVLRGQLDVEKRLRPDLGGVCPIPFSRSPSPITSIPMLNAAHLLLPFAAPNPRRVNRRAGGGRNGARWSEGVAGIAHLTRGRPSGNGSSESRRGRTSRVQGRSTPRPCRWGRSRSISTLLRKRLDRGLGMV